MADGPAANMNVTEASMTAELFVIPYSPWSEKARWALDHHGVTFRERAHVPLFGEPLLRLLARRLRGSISVPAYLDGDEAVVGSWQIARHLEQNGGAAPDSLFPAGQEQALARYNELSERLLAAGRTLVTHRISLDPEAKDEALPFTPPGPLRKLVRPLADVGIGFLRRKYRFGTAELGECEDILQAGLEELRGELQARGAADEAEPRTLLERFSYADIAMATVLQCIAPVDDTYIPLGPASRRCWTQPRLRERFADLVTWRDALYQRFR